MFRPQRWNYLGLILLLLAVLTTHARAPVKTEPPAKAELLHSIAWQDQDKEQGFPAHIFNTGVSENGKLFFGTGDAGPTGLIRIFEVATGKQIQELRPDKNAWFSNAAFVPGGKYLKFTQWQVE
jgi:hypothetical protein